MRKKNIFLASIVTIFLISLIGVNASSSCNLFIDCTPPGVSDISGLGTISAQNNGLFSNDSAYARTHTSAVGGPIYTVTVSSQMTYLSNGTTYTAYGPTNSMKYGGSYPTYPDSVTSTATANTNNAVTAYGTHSLSSDTFGSSYGYTDQNF